MRDFLILSTAADKTQREKQNDRPGHGDQNAADIEPVHRAIPQLRADEAADDGADNADQGRHDESAGIAPGHDEFREGSGDEAEKDPDDDTHDSLPRALARKPSMSGPIADRKPDQLSPHDEGRLARPRISNRRMLSRANRNAPGRTSIEAVPFSPHRFDRRGKGGWSKPRDTAARSRGRFRSGGHGARAGVGYARYAVRCCRSG